MIRLAELSGNPKYFRWNFIENPSFIDRSQISLKSWYVDHYWIWDCDSCDDVTSFWVMVFDHIPPKFFKIVHSWWWHNYGKEDAFVANEIDVEEVTKGDLGLLPAGHSVRENLKFVV